MSWIFHDFPIEDYSVPLPSWIAGSELTAQDMIFFT